MKVRVIWLDPQFDGCSSPITLGASYEYSYISDDGTAIIEDENGEISALLVDEYEVVDEPV